MNKPCTIIISPQLADRQILSTSEIPASMIPLNGRPLIGIQLDFLINQGIKDVIFLVKEQKRILKDYILKAYKHKINPVFVDIKERKGDGHSIIYAKNFVNTKNVLIISGTTIFEHKINFKENTIFYQKKDKTKEQINKQKIFSSNIYYFKDKEVLFEKTLKTILDKTNIHTDISLLNIAMKIKHKKEECEKWYDCSTLENYNKTKRTLITSRHFNSISIDEDDTITKKSKNKDLLKKEITWYLSIPERLSIYTPKIVDYNIKKPFLTMEYCGYNTLAEQYLFSNINPLTWKLIFKKLLNILKKFNEYKGNVTKNDVEQMYWTKTKKRIDEAKNQKKELKKIMKHSHLEINGIKYKNFDLIEKDIKKKIKKLYNKKHNGIIHGDFCFNNILMDMQNQTVKIIDPRGEFGSQKINGDIKYDVAKLRHSVAGLYDYLVAGLFDINIQENKIKLTIHHDKNIGEIINMFDELLSKDWNINQIKLIEGLLFVSMVPLHAESIERQLAMYATGIIRLNEVITR